MVRRAIGQVRCNFALRFYLDVIANPAEKIICGAGCAARAGSNLGCAGRVDLDAEQPALRMMIFCISSAW